MTATAPKPGSVAAAFVERATRREDGIDKPLGPKAARTRAAILLAAAERFAEAGYARTTVGDVAERAGVSLGTVYQYFRDRSDLLGALVSRTVGEMLEGSDPAWQADEGLQGLTRVLDAFVVTYAEVAGMAKVWEEVTHLDDRLAEVRRRLGRAFTREVERELRRAGATGVVRGDLDPFLTATALAGMVDRTCYVLFAFDPPRQPVDPLEVARTLAELWHAAIRR